VTGWDGPDGEPTLADVQREFAGWECWRGTSGLYYARMAGRPRRHKADAVGEDPRDLRDEIIRAKWRQAEEHWRNTGQWPDGDPHLGH
jgi:hypothetical protein